MCRQINEIYALDLKPAHPGADEMAKRLKALERQTGRREPGRSKSGRSAKALVSASERETRVAQPAFLKSLVDDLDRYVDLCLARFLVWRETRRRRKARKDQWR